MMPTKLKSLQFIMKEKEVIKLHCLVGACMNLRGKMDFVTTSESHCLDTKLLIATVDHVTSDH